MSDGRIEIRRRLAVFENEASMFHNVRRFAVRPLLFDGPRYAYH